MKLDKDSVASASVQHAHLAQLQAVHNVCIIDTDELPELLWHIAAVYSNSASLHAQDWS